MLKRFLRALRGEVQNDPTRDPNWCWTHGMMYPQCAGMH